MIDDILLQVNKPARYIGREWNASGKDFAKADIKFALAFPDLYEIGMSNLGFRIIYGILNSVPDVCCERFFSCASDMEAILRERGREIVSLESKKSLRDFDLVGFSLGSELGYTNVLNILELGGVPLEASLRTQGYPLIIGGGPAALNPEPMHEFFDVFIIGEAEDAILEFLGVYRKYKDEYRAGKMSKQDLLFMFSGIEGVYAPSLYEVKYSPGGAQEEFEPKIKGLSCRIKKRFVKDLDSAFFPLDWLVPYIQIVHDRITIEVMRGCPNRCRFCQARSAYFPFRQRTVKKILNLAQEAYKRSGYEEISLGGLSVGEYAHMPELLPALIGLFKAKAVGVSLPSLKATAMVGNFSSLIAGIKKTGLTFAPEAGTEKLRGILGKDFNEQDFFQAIEEAYASGYQHIKLYFMIGLPGEEEWDLDGIIELARRASEARRKAGKFSAEVNISVNTFIPKPHTPFQWFGMQDLESIKNKQDYLKGKIRNKRLKLNFHNLRMSFLEGVFSRGDRRLSGVILRAFKKGARFDSWADQFAFEKWEEAFRETGIDPSSYLKGKNQQELLPWDFLEAGITKEALIAEFNKTIALQSEARYNLNSQAALA